MLRLEVSDGTASVATSTTIRVAPAEPFAFAFAGDRQEIVDTPVHFDATGATPDAGIESYTWDFGDGSSTASGAAVDHTFSAPSDADGYTVTVTLDGSGQTLTVAHQVIVIPTPVTPGLEVTTTSGSSPLSGVQVVVVGGQAQSSVVTDGSGHAFLQGLADGAYTVYAYRSGYTPAVAQRHRRRRRRIGRHRALVGPGRLDHARVAAAHTGGGRGRGPRPVRTREPARRRLHGQPRVPPRPGAAAARDQLHRHRDGRRRR